jgi:hypothetical protein
MDQRDLPSPRRKGSSHLASHGAFLFRCRFCFFLFLTSSRNRKRRLTSFADQAFVAARAAGKQAAAQVHDRAPESTVIVELGRSSAEPKETNSRAWGRSLESVRNSKYLLNISSAG